MTTTPRTIDEAREAVRISASISYDAYMAAKRDLAAMETATTALQPARAIVVTGNTYPHRDELRALGLRWQAGLHAWTGTVRGQIALPRGCYETTHGEAAVASMDYADSDY